MNECFTIQPFIHSSTQKTTITNTTEVSEQAVQNPEQMYQLTIISESQSASSH